LVLYGCKTWSLTVREEHRLKVFEDRVLRRIFGPKRDEVTKGWRKLFAKYNYNDQVEESEIGMACSTNGREEECV
jgi:hypothetical protein